MANLVYILFTSRLVVRPKVCMIASSVFSLLTPSGPLAIIRTISFVIINALKSVFRCGLWSHISKKFAGIFQPLITHFYSSPAVIIPIFDVRISTSLFCTVVGGEFRRKFSAYCLPVSYTGFRSLIFVKTSAALSGPFTKTPPPYDNFAPTIANARPATLSPFVYPCGRDNRKSPALFTSHIYKMPHAQINTFIQSIVNTFYQIKVCV